MIYLVMCQSTCAESYPVPVMAFEAELDAIEHKLLQEAETEEYWFDVVAIEYMKAAE